MACFSAYLRFRLPMPCGWYGFALECISFQVFLFPRGAKPLAASRCLEQTVQGTFGLEVDHERYGLYASGPGTGGSGPGLDKSQSHGGRRHRQERTRHRRGLPPPLWRTPRRAGSFRRLHGIPGGGHDVCDPGALLPPRQAAALHGSRFGVGHFPCGGWLWGPQPIGSRQGSGISPCPRSGGGNRGFAERM